VALAVAQTLSIALSLAHVVFVQSIALLVVAAALAAAWRYSLWLRRGEPAAAPRPPPRPFVQALSIAVLAMSAAIYLLSWISALAKPDLSWDGNSYHIPMIHLWARRGYIHWIDFDYDPGPDWGWIIHWLFNGYPKGAETISFLLVRACGSSHPVNTNNLVFLPLGVAGIAAAARSLGSSRLAAWTAGAAFGLVPVIVGQGLTAYVDASLACCVAGLVGCVSVVFPRLLRGVVPWRAVPGLASAVGVTAAAKSSGLAPSMLALALLVGACAWRVVRIEPSVSVEGATLERDARWPLARVYLLFLGAVVVLTLGVTSYWYLRSWAHTGNPLSPVRVAVLGHEIFAGVSIKDSVSEDALTPDFMSSWPSWKRVAFTWLQGGPGLGDLLHKDLYAWSLAEHHWPRSIRWYDARDGGLGYLWALACIPAMAFVGASAVRTLSKRSVASRGIVGSPAAGGPALDVLLPMFVVVAVTFLAVPMNWWARYTAWIYALGLPCVALAIDRASISLWSGVAPQTRRTMRAFAWARLGARAWLVVCFGLASYESLYQFRYSGLEGGFLALPWQVTYTPAGLWHALVWYDHPTYFYRYMSALDREVVTRSEPVALGPLPVGAGPFVGELSMPVGLRDLVFLSLETAADGARLRDVLDRHRVRYLYWSDELPTPSALEPLKRREDRVVGLWRVYEVGPSDPHALSDVREK
jgi:hypothetical protein